jgi:tRNA dimethylallyltransferase
MRPGRAPGDPGDLYPLLFIVGPTACGKTELAAQAAEAARARGWAELPILNCDSVQVYASVEVGAAKPSLDQLARAPHRLLGHVAEGAAYAVGDYLRDAAREIEGAQRRGIPGACAVGGSGFYAQALEFGMTPAPPSDPGLRARLRERQEREGLAALHAELAARDPGRAARVAPTDSYRILRGLEVLELQPLTLTELDRAFAARRAPQFRARKIGLFRARERLRQAVEERVDAMLAAGLLAETEALRARGLSSWAPLRAVGYKEAQAALDGDLPLARLREAIVTSTMQLAKRQLTWFRRDSSIAWRDADEAFAQARSDAIAWLEETSAAPT